MPQIRPLRKPPITEAIIDIRVMARSGFQAEKFSELKERLQDRFPIHAKRHGKQFTVQVGPAGPVFPEPEDLGFQGYFFKTEDEKNIAQFRIDGFTFNRLKPYTSWNEIFPLAMELWSLYRSIAVPEAVVRVALRYINHLPLLAEANTLASYLRTPPVIPDELPQQLGAFLSRVTIQDPETQKAAHVTQVLEAGAAGKQARLLLDIDAFKTNDLMSDDDAISAVLYELRDFKNLIFFSYLTEETLERFE